MGGWEGGKMGRWERWEVSEAGRWGRWEGSEVTRWERWESSEVARWEREGGRIVRQKRGRYLILFKDGGHKMSPRFPLFVSDVNQENEGVAWVQDFLVWLQG